MNPLYPAAHEVQKFLRKKRWRFCIIGGLAVIRWGRVRATDDVDLCLLTRFGEEERVVTALLKRFAGRIADAHSFALRSRVVLCQASNGVAVDIALAGVPYEERVIERASKYSFAPKISLVTASAEDLIVLKAFADRDGDWSDIRGIIERQQGRLEWDCVFRELTALCELKDDTGPLDRLMVMRDEEEQHDE